jgi:cation diffusion facilitator CzcD-associated flavoprotein CzcO
MTVTSQQADYFDIIIIGAGISGIDAAYRIAERNPGLTYTIMERRAQIGGTRDLFRYPGVRSDSSIFTLSFRSSLGPGGRVWPTAFTSAST